MKKHYKWISALLITTAVTTQGMAQKTSIRNLSDQKRTQVKHSDNNSRRISESEQRKGTPGTGGGNQQGVTQTGSEMSRQDAQAALDFHNKARREVGVAPLVWSTRLSTIAQNWADHLASSGCYLQHSPDPANSSESLGENLFIGKGKVYTGVDASKSWYSEKKDFRNVPLNENNWSGTGHYSQMVWHSTQSMGMGVARCADGSIIIVAVYDPAGNYMGEKAY